MTDGDAFKRPGAFGRLGAAMKNAAAEKKAAKEQAARQLAEDALAAGALLTSGVFGTSTIEIFENGYVRVASWNEGASATGPRTIDKTTPYEKLRSIRFTDPEGESRGSSSLDSSLAPTVAKLLKGGKGLIRSSAPGMAAAGLAHVASNAARKSFLTIATDKQIHTLSNQTTNSVGLKTSNKGHNDVGRALEAAGNAALGVANASSQGAPDTSTADPRPELNAATPHISAPTLSERMRELAELHRDGILSDEEFASAKAKLLAGL